MIIPFPPKVPEKGRLVLAVHAPLHDRCIFRYGREGELTVTLYTLKGKKVRTLHAPASSDVVWDGRNDGGSWVEAGSYLFVARAGSRRYYGTVTVIR